MPERFRLGFTGSRHGMTPVQYHALDVWLYAQKHLVTEIHHGGCVGADAEFHNLCREHGLGRRIVVHPSNMPRLTAKLTDREHVTLPPLAPITRNRCIVNATDAVIATPHEQQEIVRSGTWATVRYTRMCEKMLILFPPWGDRTPLSNLA